MKFFRQTKETKRKISFFVALAMVISLLPVSPVAKAASQKETVNFDVYSKIENTKITSVQKNDSVTGSAIITLESSVEGRTISSASITAVRVVKTGVTTSSSVSSSTGHSVSVTSSAVTEQPDVTHSEKVDKGNLIVTVKGIVTGTAILLEGTVELSNPASTSEPTSSPAVTGTPSASPSTNPSASPSTSPSTSPTAPGTSATPVSKCDVEVKDVGFNYADIKLTVTGISTGSSVSVAKDTVIKFEIEPKDSEKSFKIYPELKTDSEAVDWTLVSGNKYKAEIKITKNVIITITGGEVLSLNVTVGDTTTKVDDAVQDTTGVKDVTIGASDNTTPEKFKEEMTAMAVANASKNTITILDENGNKTDLKVTDEIYDQIISSLEDASTKMNTALNVKVATDGAIKEAQEVASKADANSIEIEGANEDAEKALGNVKETVGKMINEEGAVILDITLENIIEMTSNGNTTKAAIAISKLGKAVKITMNVPDKYKEDNKVKDGFYYAIRIHEGKITILPCTLEADGKISFKSDKFSTYIISYAEKPAGPSASPSTEPSTSPSTAPSPTGTGGNGSGSLGGGGIGGYVPTTSSTPAPSASPSAAPSASPSASASAAPSGSAVPSGSANPSDPSTGNTSEPTKAPGTTATQKPDNTDKDDNTNGGSTSSVKVGKKVTVSGSKYKVTAVKGTRTVQFTNGKKNAKSVVIPSTVKVSGKNYKVTTIAKNAFKGNKKLKKVTIGANVNKIGANAFKGCSKLKNIVIKTKKLTAKKVGNNAFKGINKKATFKVPKAKVKAYKKIVKAKGAGKNVKVKK